MANRVVVTTAEPGTVDAAKALELAVESNWPDADFEVLVSSRLRSQSHFRSAVTVAAVHGTPFAVTSILSEADQLALSLPKMIRQLLERYEQCLYIGPGLLLVRPPDRLLAAAQEAGTAVVVPATITPRFSLTPSLGPIDAGPFLPETRVVAVDRRGDSFLLDWATTLEEAVLDIDQRSIAWVANTFLERSVSRSDVKVEGRESFLHWADFAAVEVGRSIGPDAALIACDALFASAREIDSAEDDPEVAWGMLVHRVHDSRPVEPLLRLIESSQAVREGFNPETPFDVFRAGIWRATDPLGKKWSEDDVGQFDKWLFQSNSAGCTRLADLLVKSDEQLFRQFFGARFDPKPLRNWIDQKGRDLLGFDPFDPAYQPRKASLPADDSDHGGIANAVAWRWNTLKSMVPGYTRRASKRIEEAFIGSDPSEKRGLNPPQHVPVHAEPDQWGNPPSGLNLLGPFRSESGLGQASRASLEAVRHLDLKFTHVDTTEKYPSRNAVDVGLTTSNQGVIGDVNLVHTNADEMLTLASGAFKHRFGGRFNAAMWFWETADLPTRSRPAFHLVDELWVASSYQRDVFGQYAQVPVHVVGLAADLPRQRDVDRSAYGWRDDELVFLFVYDALSSYGRKNPRKAVDAYVKAFSPSFTDVRFILKVSNLNKFPASQRELQGLAERYPSITIIDEYLPREGVMNLMAAADVYVSLHAAEGFGLTLLEAMALGTPVICTGYSGNMDFTTYENSWLVGYDMMRTEEPTGPYPKGSVWASPRLDDAVEVMRKIGSERDIVAQKAELAHTDALEAASLERYAERLHQHLRRVL